MITLSEIRIHPVKSCAGLSLPRARLDRYGLLHDRRFLLVDAAGHFLSQRQLPAMARIRTRLEGATLRLRAPGQGDLTLPLEGRPGPRRSAELWGQEVGGIDQGDPCAHWLSRFLGLPCRLLHMPRDFDRRVSTRYFAGLAHTAYSDGYPLLLISEESLAELNQRLSHPVAMERFRPNLVVRGGPPFGEDTWRRLRIGDQELVFTKPCSRCAVTTVDPESGQRGPEPLRTLARFRRFPDGVLFGVNLVHLGRGLLETGAPVEILDAAEAPFSERGEP